MKKRKRLSNIEWVTERFKLIRKFNEHTSRQQEIIQLLDKTELSPLEFKQLHYLATEEKVELQKQDALQRADMLEQKAQQLKRRAKQRHGQFTNIE
ncbi:hypothetical protein A3Q29_21535 [Providencia stuartii]|uniref:Uncharacterized protein n=1 Tax=Providencia stuartii TaxID=588 RepID=A0A1S1HP33_PROST|nr:hypothetical protein A3Q29_21535 [Providencia stuartii]